MKAPCVGNGPEIGEAEYYDEVRSLECFEIHFPHPGTESSFEDIQALVIIDMRRASG